MTMLFRNFFYAVGFTMLFFMYISDANTVMFTDVVRVVQNPRALKIVLILTVLFICLEFSLSGTPRPVRDSNSSASSSHGSTLQKSHS